jgi:diguanylate cyclase (GGDEF)-like protein/PAS domain S-box-containing protein
MEFMSRNATTKPSAKQHDPVVCIGQPPHDSFSFAELAPLLELMPVAVAIFDADDRLIVFNDRFRTTQGHDITPFIAPGITFPQMVDMQVRFGSHPKVEGGARVWREERLAAFYSGNCVRVIHWPQLGWHQVHDHRLPNGYTMIVGTDISDVKGHSEQLELARQRLTDYVNVATDWFWETDANHRFTFMSDRLTETTGLEPGTYIGRDRREVAKRSNDRQAWEQHLVDLNEHRAFRDFRYAVHRSDGLLIHLSISGQPVFDADGEFTGYRGTGINVTREVEGQQANERFLEAIESVSDGYSLWDKDGKLIVTNSRWREIAAPTSTIPIAPGMDYEEHIRDNVSNGAFPSALEDPERWICDRLHRRHSGGDSFELQRENGCWLLVQERSTPDGGVLQILRDISDLKQRELALLQSEERFKGFAESAADWFWELDQDFRITFVSERYKQLTGKNEGDCIGRMFSVLASDDDTQQQSIANAVQVLRDGHALHDHDVQMAGDDTATAVHSLSGQAVCDAHGKVCGYRGTGRDVTQARLLSRQLAHQASHDELTGLVNRRGFEQRLARAMESVQGGRSQCALCYLDLDQFKVVNDSCGHAAGDELLRQLAKVLQDKVRGRDTVARFGGDEFALLLENCSLEEARPIADALRCAVEAFDFHWTDKLFRLGASIGLVMLRPDASIAEVMRVADSACYMAKEQGRNRVHVYEPDDAEQSRRESDLNWVARINEALSEDRFMLFGQLIRQTRPVDSSAHRHFEVLIRMRGRNGESIAPGAFLPAAERFGLATRIDRWVIRQVFDLLEQSRHLLDEGNFLSINLSGQSLSDTDFCAHIVHQLRSRQIRGDQICFEITETAAIADMSAAQQFMQQTTAQGCHFALDDFGTGLSSFAYLRDLPVDFVKIDGAFIKDIENDPIHLAMVRSIHDIAHVLGKQTIAEFVANENTTQRLAEIGIDYVQGFGIGKPAPLLQLLGG